MQTLQQKLAAGQFAFLARATDIQSATMNFEGVRRVGALFRAAFDSLDTRKLTVLRE